MNYVDENEMNRCYLNLVLEIVTFAISEYQDCVAGYSEKKLLSQRVKKMYPEAKREYARVTEEHSHYKGKKRIVDTEHPAVVAAKKKYVYWNSKAGILRQYVYAMIDAYTFFKGEWFESLCDMLDFDPNYIRRRINLKGNPIEVYQYLIENV